MIDDVPEGWRTPRGRAAWAVRRANDRILECVRALTGAYVNIEDAVLVHEDRLLKARLPKIDEALAALFGIGGADA